MRKELILKISLHFLLKNGANHFSIHNIADEMKINEEKILKCFPEGDHELMMDAVEYAGKLWIEKLGMELKSMVGTEEKRVEYLVREYINGTSNYSNSLSIYIDLWKMLRDQEDPYIRQRLKTVYQLYIEQFSIMMEEIMPWQVSEKRKRALSTLMTSLSDALHIQRMVFKEDLEIEEVIKILVYYTFMIVKEGCNE